MHLYWTAICTADKHYTGCACPLRKGIRSRPPIEPGDPE